MNEKPSAHGLKALFANAMVFVAEAQGRRFDGRKITTAGLIELVLRRKRLEAVSWMGIQKDY